MTLRRLKMLHPVGRKPAEMHRIVEEYDAAVDESLLEFIEYAR